MSSGGSSCRARVPLSVAWLDSLALAVSASAHPSRKRGVQYVVAAHHRPSGTKWTVERPFDAYRELQRALRTALQRGHQCGAQCPWLFTFVASCFPKPRLLRSSSSERVVADRCAALTVYLETLRSALLAKESYACTVLTGAVTETFTAFVCAGVRDRLPLRQWAFAAVQRLGAVADPSKPLPKDENSAELSSSRSRKPLSVDRALAETVDADDDEAADAHGSSDAVVCRVCDRSIADRHYTVALACGHEFHDECVVQRLNLRMVCPACGEAVAS